MGMGFWSYMVGNLDHIGDNSGEMGDSIPALELG